MPIVTALERHRRKSEQVELYLDDKFALNLPLEQAAKLRRGQCLSPAEVAALGQAEALAGATDRALRFLAVRPRSSAEVRRHLRKKAVSEARIEQVIQRLRQRDYIDDLAFARYWREQRERFKPLSSRALRYELSGKGVADEIIESALEDLDEAELAYRAVNARLSRFRGDSRQNFRLRVGSLLSRRGFDYGVIDEVARRLEAELDESDSGYFCGDEAD